ncbi:MAG: type II toxin-antitoxin system VapC family toxin [Kineosporiaceae bacterium]|nr:type II toxin-antitoxin system VapC family toxin [Kineosporiaceae bacterium]
MLVPDVNLLLYAHRGEASDHERYRGWLQDLVTGSTPFGMSELVLSGFLRITTNTRVFRTPSTSDSALAFVAAIVESPRCVRLRPGPRNLQIFTDLCRTVQATGNVVPDAYHAALAIEHGCTWITADRGFARFPGLRWSSPFAD